MLRPQNTTYRVPVLYIAGGGNREKSLPRSNAGTARQGPVLQGGREAQDQAQAALEAQGGPSGTGRCQVIDVIPSAVQSSVMR